MDHFQHRLPVPIQDERIESRILLLRGQKVLLSSDLAGLYGVEAKVLVQAVKRNLDRFPVDFMFQLTRKEMEILRSQIVTSRSWGGHRHLPYAFTEQGVAMLSSVLRSRRAVQVNIAIVRAFVRLRQMLLSNVDLARRLDEMERRYDVQFKAVFQAIRELAAPAAAEKPRIGFQRNTTPVKPMAKATHRMRFGCDKGRVAVRNDFDDPIPGKMRLEDSR